MPRLKTKSTIVMYLKSDFVELCMTIELFLFKSMIDQFINEELKKINYPSVFLPPPVILANISATVFYDKVKLGLLDFQSFIYFCNFTSWRRDLWHTPNNLDGGQSLFWIFLPQDFWFPRPS